METSLCMIKPEGMRVRDEIKKMIEAAGLKITSCKDFVFWEELASKLYPHVAAEGGWLWEVTLAHLVYEMCEVVVVTGENAIARLVEVCGTHTNPNECAPESIRAQFSRRRFVRQDHQATYWCNVVHRPKNAEEFARDRAALEEIFKLQTSPP